MTHSSGARTYDRMQLNEQPNQTMLLFFRPSGSAHEEGFWSHSRKAGVRQVLCNRRGLTSLTLLYPCSSVIVDDQDSTSVTLLQTTMATPRTSTRFTSHGIATLIGSALISIIRFRVWRSSDAHRGVGLSTPGKQHSYNCMA